MKQMILCVLSTSLLVCSSIYAADGGAMQNSTPTQDGVKTDARGMHDGMQKNYTKKADAVKVEKTKNKVCN